MAAPILGLSFGLPSGKYGVWFVMEDAGYWEYYQSWRFREVNVSGGATLSQKMDLAQWWKMYYAHEDDEDLPGQSLRDIKYFHVYCIPSLFDLLIVSCMQFSIFRPNFW